MSSFDVESAAAQTAMLVQLKTKLATKELASDVFDIDVRALAARATPLGPLATIVRSVPWAHRASPAAATAEAQIRTPPSGAPCLHAPQKSIVAPTPFPLGSQVAAKPTVIANTQIDPLSPPPPFPPPEEPPKSLMRQLGEWLLTGPVEAAWMLIILILLCMVYVCYRSCHKKRKKAAKAAAKAEALGKSDGDTPRGGSEKADAARRAREREQGHGAGGKGDGGAVQEERPSYSQRAYRYVFGTGKTVKTDEGADANLRFEAIAS
eukprot:6101279-Prymnesium_polylepis.1